MLPVPEPLTVIKYKAKSYAQVTTIEGLKTALYKNGPCPIFFPVYNYSEEFWKKKNPYDEMLGGHAVTIISYDHEGFGIRNSWGKNWGNNGYTKYKYEDFGMHWEIWTTIDDESPVPDPKPEPEPESKGCCLSLKSLFKKN